eukprot:Skav236194  [mRNA]  locus=scaffold1795:12591:13328:+ [translate_table: standard]
MEDFSPWLLALDWMHCKYLGHDMLVFGSCLSLLVNFVMVGSPQECLQRCWHDIVEYYNTNQVPIRYKYLNRLSMFERKGGAYPKLRGKAAEIKYLAGPMLFVWEKYCNQNLQVHRDILLYLKLNFQVEEMLIVYKDSISFPAGESDKFEHLVTTMLLLLTRIAGHFIGEKLFNITQKAHFLQHSAMLARYINPRLVWCFQGEDQQKRMSCLAKTCVKGQRPGMTIAKMLARYRLALRLRFEQHQD